MKIEEAIKQKRFKSVHEKLLVNLMYTSNVVMFHQGQFFKEYNLTSQQYNILRILRGQYPKAATVNLLIDRMLDKSSNASRLVEKLRSKGLVSRVRSKSDRRSVNVKISEEGLKLLSEIEERSVFPTHMNEEKAEQLNELLDQFRTFYKQ